MESKSNKVKESELKYVKVCSTGQSELFKSIGERVFKGELKWSYYTTDNDKGYHYYLIIKN